MLGQAFVVIFVGIICIFAVGFVLEVLNLFGLGIRSDFSLLLVIPMAAVAWVASKGREQPNELVPEVIILFVFLGTLIIVANIGHWFFWLAWLAAYGAMYGKPFLAGVHYLNEVQPLERQAETQTALTQKLDADAELAEATVRYERARVALEDAEWAADEAERRANGNQS